MKGLMKASYNGLAMWRGWRGGRIAKRVYVGECAGSHSMGRLQKRWIDTVKDCLRRRGLDVRQARRRMQGRCECWGFVSGNAWSVSRKMNP